MLRQREKLIDEIFPRETAPMAGVQDPTRCITMDAPTQTSGRDENDTRAPPCPRDCTKLHEDDVTPPEDDDPSERTVFFSRDSFASAVADPMGHYLVVLEGTSPGKRLEIGADPITIGRAAGRTLVVEDGDVSRSHARVALVNGAVIVEDLGSTNGTFVDSARVSGAAILKDGSMLRLGGQVIKYERRSKSDVKKAEELERDIKKATDYVSSLLPSPVAAGPVRATWRFVPSAQLGGDAFGYHWLDPGTFVFYLVDVSGHGVGAAMHSVTVLNVLRQRALPNVDFKNPPEVLASLNSRFQMDVHNGLYFTMWYGVYRTADRALRYGTAGHGPAFLVPPDRSEPQPLGMSAMMIGMMPDQTYEVKETTVPPDSTVFLFSDGAYEVATKDGGRWELENFLPLLTEAPAAGVPEPERIYRAVRQAAAPGPFEDDFSLLAITFP
jgi:serine phosphatase RsbU (regulator of sigma subunit)